MPSPARATTATSVVAFGGEHAELGAVEDPAALGPLGRHGDLVERPAAGVVGEGQGPGDGAGGDLGQEAVALLGRARPRGPWGRTASWWPTGARGRRPGRALRRPRPSRRWRGRRRRTPRERPGRASRGRPSSPRASRAARRSRRRRARTRAEHSFSRNERTEARSSSCSLVNSSSTALPSRRVPVAVSDPAATPRHGRRQIGASVSDAHVSLSGLCYLHAAPFSGKDVAGVPRGVAGPWRKPGPATTGARRGPRAMRRTGTEVRSPTLCGAPLAQRQSNGLLIRRFRVQIPRGALEGPR